MLCTTIFLLALGACSGAVQWTATDIDNVTCVVFAAETVSAKLNIAVDYQNATVPIDFAINDTVSVVGNCNDRLRDEPANSIVVEFFPDGKKPASAVYGKPWRLFLWFTKEQEISFKLKDYVLEVADSDMYNTTTQNFTKSTDADLDIQATGTNAFKCSVSGLALSSHSSIDLKDMRVIANAKFAAKDFPKEQLYELCQLDSRTSEVVPIVVGACLAGLVVVVLIAYLVGRARAKRQGYASV